MVARRPADTEGHLWWGLAQLLVGDANGCLTALEHRTDPGALSMWLSTLRGLALVADEQAIDAISSFDEALDIDRDLIAALLGRSFAQASLGNVDGAITDLTQALELEPDNADMLALRGDRYAEVADFDLRKRALPRVTEAQAMPGRGDRSIEANCSSCHDDLRHTPCVGDVSDRLWGSGVR